MLAHQPVKLAVFLTWSPSLSQVLPVGQMAPHSSLVCFFREKRLCPGNPCKSTNCIWGAAPVCNCTFKSYGSSKGVGSTDFMDFIESYKIILFHSLGISPIKLVILPWEPITGSSLLEAARSGYLRNCSFWQLSIHFSALDILQRRKVAGTDKKSSVGKRRM